MTSNFASEKEGQNAFFQKLIEIDNSFLDAIQLNNYTDGVINATLLEFKKTKDEKTLSSEVLFQSIKYLSKLRLNGKFVPSQILLISLNTDTALLYESKDFFEEIHKVYIGGASKDNKNFKQVKAKESFNIKGNWQKIITILQQKEYLKVRIDVNCVSGYANTFYNSYPTATKSDFFAEIKNPKHLYILPWKGKEIDFKYIMDLLNDKKHKKELGAFYTPKAYIKLSTKMVRESIKEIIKGNDYIILDRCGGTGNLEEFFTDKNVDDITLKEIEKFLDKKFLDNYIKDYYNVNLTQTIKEFEATAKPKVNIRDYLFDNELSHVIINTFELKEWLVLVQRMGDKVRCIIPPPDLDLAGGNIPENNEGLLTGGDALNKRFVMGDYGDKKDGELTPYQKAIKELKEIVANESINVIMLENPPYTDTTSNVAGKSAVKGFTNYVKEQMKSDKVSGASLNELSNHFIWSAFKYYLKKGNDFYILYSPIKYWKSNKILDKFNHKFMEGYALNRLYFHASESMISLIRWKNNNIQEQSESIKLKVVNIKKENIKDNDEIGELDYYKNENKIKDGEIEIRKVYKTFANDENLWDKRKDKNIACINLSGFNLDSNSVMLHTTREEIKGHGSCFFLQSDNFIKKLPLFCAKLYPQENWYERDVYFTTADKGEEYIKDKEFLKSCLIFTCLSQRNKCRSFISNTTNKIEAELALNNPNQKDKYFIKNELTLLQKTKSDEVLTDLLKQHNLVKNSDDLKLLNCFDAILKEVRKDKDYNKDYIYGTYQIIQEFNKIIVDGEIMNQEKFKEIKNKDKELKKIVNYSIKLLNPELDRLLDSLKIILKDYYKTYIEEKLFEYELLK